MESAQTQMKIWADAGQATFVSTPGAHGSSMLVEERVGASTAETWDFVLGFLRGVLISR
jgi:hypothetical protein